jgi:uncharacterized protein
MAGPVQIQTGHHQWGRRRAYCQILVDGQDVTDKFNPYLISVQVVDNVDEEDLCNLELDDRNAELSIPEDDAVVQVRLGWAGEGPRIPLFRQHEVDEEGRLMGYDLDTLPTDIPPGELPFEAGGMLVVFNGYVHNVESGFGKKAGGRRLWVEAKGSRGKADTKSHDMKTWGTGNESQGSEGGAGIPLSTVLGDAAKAAGMGFEISPSMGAISRSSWFQNESAMHMAERIAREVGGQVKISGNKLIFTSATDGRNSAGELVSLIIAEWGTNLISWRIKPFVARPQFGKTNTKFFDVFKGAWDKVGGSVGGSGPFGMATAMSQRAGAAPNKQVGEQHNGGMKSDSETNRGTGWVLINGEPSALAGSRLKVIGARPGVDGVYGIRQAEHNYLRSGGYTTRCDLINPELVEKDYKYWSQKSGQGT